MKIPNSLSIWKQVNKIKKKMPKKLCLMENVDLKQAFADIITNPNENWKN